jgi:large subunit ribosomal protein L33
MRFISPVLTPLEQLAVSPYNQGFATRSVDVCVATQELATADLRRGNEFPSPLNPVPSTAMPSAKRKKKVETVFLVCEESGDHNYTLKRKTGGEKLKLKKYSPRLRKHTLHTEKKK